MKTNNIDLVKIVEEVWQENELQSGVYKVAALTAMQKLQDIYEDNPTGEGQSTAVVKSVCKNCNSEVEPIPLGYMCPSCACDM